MIDSKKHHNKIKNLLNCKKILSLEQKQFLYYNGYENFDIIKKMLIDEEISKSNHKYNAIKFLYMLRGCKKVEEFVEILNQFINDVDIEIRSYCFNLLTILATECFRGITNEIDKVFVEEKIIPILNNAATVGVSSDSVELFKNLLKIEGPIGVKP